MNSKRLLLPSLFLPFACALSASPTLSVGTPADSYLATPSAVTPRFGVLINFDSINASPSGTALSPTQYALQGVKNISSPDGLLVYPYSSQSGPNEVYDPGAGGTANITVNLSGGVSKIGIGIADSDPTTITFQALNSSGNPFGMALSLNVLQSGDPNNYGNGYYMLTDTTPDIYGFVITQATANATYSGLAIDDLQVAPEPASFALFGIGGGLVLLLGRRRSRTA